MSEPIPGVRCKWKPDKTVYKHRDKRLHTHQGPLNQWGWSNLVTCVSPLVDVDT